MTEPNDKFLDEYLRRESLVSQRYRELGSNEVPAGLDAAVLSQARAAIEKSRVRKPRWMSWGAPLALAASAVMAVAIVLEVGVQEEVRTSGPRLEQAVEPAQNTQVTQSTEEQASLKAEADTPPPPLPAENLRAQRARAIQSTEERAADAVRAEAPGSAAAEREAIESVVVTSSKPQTFVMESALPVEVIEDVSVDEGVADELPAPAVDAASARLSSSESKAHQTEQRSDTPMPASPVSARAVSQVRAAAPPPQSAAPAQGPRLEPDVWLERIRQLRQEAKVLEADEQWREFVAAYPEYEVEKTDAARPKP